MKALPRLTCCWSAALFATGLYAANPAQWPQPRVVTPGGISQDGTSTPPSDAVVIFDGQSAENFTDLKGNPITWEVQDGCLMMGRGDVVTKQEFSDAQIHVEFSTRDDGKRHANSGLYLHHLYEIQILDSFSENPHGPGQQCGAIYQLFPPSVNASAPPGEWQTFDIIFHGAKLDDGNVFQPARITVFHNGVLVQYNRALRTGTGAGRNRQMVEKGPIRIQAHGGDVKFRSMWFRPIPPIGRSMAGPLEKRNAGTHTRKVTPASLGSERTPGTPPSDAVLLFDGVHLGAWSQNRNRSQPPSWTVRDGSMQVQGDTIVTRREFVDVQLHVEWATPAEMKGQGQGRGNSGIKMQTKYEVQVLDSFQNETYPDGHAGAVYGQYPPLVNASRPPGSWQTYDIVFRAPKFDDGGQPVDPGSFTVLHNGVLVQDHVINRFAPRLGPTGGVPLGGRILLQSKGIPVRYRNIWLRELEPQVAGAPTPPKPRQFIFDGQSATFEAEEAAVEGPDIMRANQDYSGNGYVDFRGPQDESITWHIQAKQGGPCTLGFRYALGSVDRPLKLVVNDKVALEKLDFPMTADWSTWGEVQVQATLVDGDNRVQLVSIGKSGGNIDCLRVSRADGS